MAIDRRSSRMGVLALVALLLLGGLGTRLWFLQGTQQKTYEARLAASKLRTVYVPAERGRIFDTKSRVVADNRRILTIAVDWSVVRRAKSRDALFSRLSGPLHAPVAELQQRWDPCFGAPAIPRCTKGNIYSTLLPLPLKEDVDEPTVNYIMERAEDFPGVTVIEDYKRVYPFAPLASHVVGYVGAITRDTLDRYTKLGYNQNERVGQFGVESSLESTLHGSWGKRVFEIDAAGSIVGERADQRIDPIAGQDVQLTIDLDVQQYAEQVLETQLHNRRALPDGPAPTKDNGGVAGGGERAHNPLDPETKFKTHVYSSSKEWGNTEWVPFSAPAGAVVVEDHSNGQVIAMASYPTFDNRWLVAGVSADKYNQLFPSTKDPDKSLLVNRAVQGQYNLGSSIKPFVAWSAINAGLITPYTPFFDQGQYVLTSIDPSRCQNNGGTARCIFTNAISKGTGKPTKYGPVEVESALAVSSDAFFYHLGEMFYVADNTHELLKSQLGKFGFGTRSGVELPFEFTGRIPDDAVKKDLVDTGKFGKNEVRELVVGDNVQVAIGQGLMAASPLQLANAYSAMANGGALLNPHVVKAIYAPLTPDGPNETADLSKGTVVNAFDQADVKAQIDLPDAVRTPIVRGLTRVINGPGTTYPPTFYNSTTGEFLFKTYPFKKELPIAGKTGTAQGAGNYPWNDSSAFAAFSLTSKQPYTVVSYLEKSGYGAKASAPVVKCVFEALADPTRMSPVRVSDPLDLSGSAAAPERRLADPSCLGGTDTTIGRG